MIFSPDRDPLIRRLVTMEIATGQRAPNFHFGWNWFRRSWRRMTFERAWNTSTSPHWMIWALLRLNVSCAGVFLLSARIGRGSVLSTQDIRRMLPYSIVMHYLRIPKAEGPHA